MASMKYWDGSKWIVFDAANAETLGGKKPSEYAPFSHIGLGGTAHKLAVPNGEAGFFSGVDKAKLDGIQAGAQKNQNAYAQIKVGTSILTAGAVGSAFEFAAGSNITLSADSLTGKITIAAAVDSIDSTTPGGIEANKIAKTNAQGRVGDSERIGGKSLYELDLRYATAGSGGGGVSQGNGEAIFGQQVDQVRVVTASAKVQIPFAGYDMTKHILFAFQNGTFIQHGKDYTINNTDKTINKLSGTFAAGTLIDYVLMTVASSGDMLKIHQYESFVKATAGQSQINISIPEFTPGLDGLNVYMDGTRLSLTNHYTLNSDGTKINLVGFTAEANSEFQFVVVKKEKINP